MFSECPAYCHIYSGCAQFLGLRVATGIPSTKEVRWVGYQTDLLVR